MELQVWRQETKLYWTLLATIANQYKYYQETPEHNFQTLLAIIAKQQNNLRSDIDH